MDGAPRSAVMPVRRLGDAALTGWRARVADAVAAPVARRTPLDAEGVRRGVGLLFFVLSLLYVLRAIDRLRR